MKQLEMGAETYVKCSRVLTRKEKSKETVLLLSNLLAVESKKTKENYRRLNYVNTFLCVLSLFLIFEKLKKLSRFLEKFIFRENNFREFLV